MEMIENYKNSVMEYRKKAKELQDYKERSQNERYKIENTWRDKIRELERQKYEDLNKFDAKVLTQETQMRKICDKHQEVINDIELRIKLLKLIAKNPEAVLPYHPEREALENIRGKEIEYAPILVDVPIDTKEFKLGAYIVRGDSSRKVKKYSLVLVGHHIFGEEEVGDVMGGLYGTKGERNFGKYNVTYEIERFETVNQAKEKYNKKKDEMGKKFWEKKDGFRDQFKYISGIYKDTKEKYTLKDFKSVIKYKCSKCGDVMTDVGYQRRYYGRGTDCYECDAKNSITRVLNGGDL